MHKRKSRILAMALATIMLLSSVVPGTAMAAEEQTSFGATTASAETEPAETDEVGETSVEESKGETSEETTVEETTDGDDETSGEDEASLDEVEDVSSEETGIEENTGDDAAEADSNDTAASDDVNNTDKDQEQPSQTEEKEQENDDENTAQDPEEVAAGRFAIRFDSEGGVVKVIVSSDEDASESDPSYTLEKSGDSVRVTERTGDSYSAVKTEEGYVLDIEEEAGASVTVIADSAEGYQVSQYAVATDTGDEENVGFAKSDADFSYTVSIDEGTRKVFSIAFEKMEEDMPAFEAEQKVGNLLVKVKAEKGVFPKGTTFKAVDIFDKDHIDITRKAADEIEGEGDSAVAAVDINFFDKDGKEIEPNGMVQVSFEDYNNCLFGSKGMTVVHISDDGNAEVLNTEVESNTVVFENNEFSPYVLMKNSEVDGVPWGHTDYDYNPIGQKPDKAWVGTSSEKVYYSTDGDYNYFCNDSGWNYTTPCFMEDTNGNREWAVCVDPRGKHWPNSYYGGGYNGTVQQVHSLNLTKALYYSFVNHEELDRIVQEGNPGIRNSWALIHLALSYYALEAELTSKSDFAIYYQQIWTACNDRFKNDILAFMKYVEDNSLPAGYTAYIAYPSDYTGSGSAGKYQCYVYLTHDTTVTIKKWIVDQDENRIEDPTDFTFQVVQLERNNAPVENVYAVKTTYDNNGNPVNTDYTLNVGDTFTLKQHEQMQLISLPMGTLFDITEVDPPPGFQLIRVDSQTNDQYSEMSAKGDISNVHLHRTYLFTFVNQIDEEPGYIQIEKKVVDQDGNRIREDDTAFTFTVDTLRRNGKPLVGITAKILYNDGSIGEPFPIKETDEFTLKQYETLQIDDVPMGTEYEISEVPKEGYSLISVSNSSPDEYGKWIAKGTILNQQGHRHPYHQFVNEETVTELGDIQIEKKVVGPDGNRIDDDTEFTFTVDTLRHNKQPLTAVTATKTKYDAAGYVIEGPIEITIQEGDEFTLKQREVLKILDLPMGTEYKISEVPKEGYSLISVSDSSPDENGKWIAKGTILDQEGHRHYYHQFTNQGDTTTSGSITIKKIVVDSEGEEIDVETEFGFRVNKLHKNGKPIDAVRAQLYDKDGYGIGGTFEIKASAHFTLKDDQKLEILDVPEGTEFEIYETEEPDGFEFVSIDPANTDPNSNWKAVGTVTEGQQDFYFEFYNKKTTEEGSISITKEVVNSNGAVIDDNAMFEFRVNWLHKDDVEIDPVTAQMYDSKGNAVGEPFEIQAFDNFKLKSKEKLEITGLPIGTEFEIFEVSNSEGYELISIDPAPNDPDILNAEGTITKENQHYSFTFKNEKEEEKGSISVTKKVVNSYGAEIDDDAVFTFNVDELRKDNQGINVTAQKYDSLGHAKGSPIAIEQGATFTLKAKEKLEITELPIGTEFKISEDSNSGGYQLISINNDPNAQNAEGTITEAHKNYAFAFKNEKQEQKGSITVTKKVEDADGKTIEDDTEFEFTMDVFKSTYDESVAPKATGQRYDSDDNKIGDPIVIEQGVQFKIKAYETMRITNIPKGTYFEFFESNLPEGYIWRRLEGKALAFGVGSGRAQGGISDDFYEFIFIYTNQKVIEPKIVTTAIDSASGTHTAYAGGQVTIEDTVTYENLTVGNTYVLKGSLIDKSTGNPIKDSEGNDVTAEKSFPAETANGTVKMKFTFNADRSFVGKSTVVFESLWYEGEKVAEHADINDEDQTIHFPKVGTSASNPETDERNLMAKENAKIVDTVSYENLVPGEEYTVKGVLKVKATGEPLKVNGSEVTAEETFEPSEPDGTVDVTFTFDATGLEDSDVVVFEELYIAGFLIAEHKDLDDEDQTIQFPDLHTNAINAASGTHNASAGGQVTIVDTVTYSNLIVGKDYVVKGHLVDKKTGETIKDVEGNEVTAEKEFPAETADGTVEVEFTFNADISFAGKTTVVFESLEYEEEVIAVHADINDEGQTIYFGYLGTSASNPETGSRILMAKENAVIVDTVSYWGLVPGEEYTVKGVLMVKATGEPLKVNGSEVTAEKTFTPSEPDGTVEVTFTFDATGLENSDVVVFEEVYIAGIMIVNHKESDDDNQTVHFPEVGTSASNPETGDRNLMAKEDAEIVDTVSYWNLVPGEEYTVKGVLMVKATGESLKVDGKEVTAEKTFTPDKPDGTVEVTFTFDATGMENSDVVVFEELYIAGILIGEHKEIEDEDQTIQFPDLHTNATDAESGTHNASAGGQVTIVDTVTYSNLIVGKDYVVKGHLVDKKTGEPIKDAEGNEVTAEKEFPAETADGTVEMEFTFNADISFAGKTTVVFESLEYEEEVIAVHADINDEAQTIYFTSIGTSASNPETGDRNLMAKEDAKIVDTVSYWNLVPGEEYTVKGVLMVKATGEPLKVNGSEVTAEETFEPSEPNGTVEVTFTFDATGLENSDVVVFEELYLGEKIIGEHKDLDDEDQTIEFPDLHTNAKDAESGTHNAFAGGQVTIVDTVTYSNLIAGKKYVVKGHLVDKKTGEPIKDAEGNEVTAEKEFPAETADGTVELEFTFNADSSFAGKTTVVFESLEDEKVEVAVHADINDEDQTVYFPKVGTSASNPVTGDSVVTVEENAKIVDTVSYENLLPGEEYTVKGVLMVKATGEPLKVNGSEVTAEETFEPSEPNGTVEVTFTFDATGLENSDVVVFEEVYLGASIIGEHKDIDDEDQTIHFPGVETKAYDEATGKKNTLAAEDRVIADEVYYSNLIAGNTYEISGEVKIKSDEDISFDEAETVPSEIIGAEGEGVISFDADKVTFIPAGNEGDAVSGTLIVRFKVDASYLAGVEIVVGETVSYKEVEIAVHRDINDDNQNDYIPDGHTVSVDKDTDIKNTLAADNRVFKDTFMYEKLLPGETYRFTGKVMVETGTTEEGATILEQIPSVMTDENGVPVENGYYEFTPETPDGTLDLYFSIDATELANKNVTVFEKVTLGGEPVIIHEVLDGTQTIYVPEGGTTAIDSETENQISLADEEVTIIDTMVYKNLIPGTEYTVKGRVMKKSTGEEIPSSLIDAKYKDAADGEEQATGSISVSENVVTFVPEQKDGALELTFVINASELKGEDTVVFERVYHNNVEVIIHENIDDESQTIHIPDGHTTASDPDTNDRSMMAEGEVLIKDRVYYENLLPGYEYAITGKVMLKPTDDREAEELEARMVDPDGNEIDEWIFTPEKSDGTEDVFFIVNADSLAGRSAVMFERIEYINPELFTRTTIVIHEDIDDEEETIHFPDGGTTALDSETGSHTAYADEEVTIFDEVKYKNLIPGKTYTVTGKLMDKDTGAAVVVDGEEIVSTKTFVPSSADGSVVISFTFDGSALAGKSVVAFETVQHKGKDVFVHADINDADQTVDLPEVRTSASDKKDGDQEISHKGTVRVIDNVKYKNLTVGTKYRVSGVLMDKNTNKPALADGKEIVAETVFTAKEKDGTVTVEFVFNSSALKDGKYVVFETIYEINAETGDENIVGTHKDINDEAQTVVRRTPKDTTGTGDDSNTWIWLIALGLAILGAAASVLIRRSRIVR